MEETDHYILVCNYAVSISSVRSGARAYILLKIPGMMDRAMIRVRSRGGRWIKKWESLAKLKDFRIVTIPKGHPRYEDAYKERSWTEKELSELQYALSCQITAQASRNPLAAPSASESH